MKESNEAWPTRKLSEVATLDRNSIAPEKILSGTKYIGLEDIDSEGKIAKPHDVANGDLASTKFSFETKHILYGKLRPYLSKIALPDFSGICSTDIIPIMPKPIINRVFLFYYLRQPELIKLATERCTGANLPRLSPNELADFNVLVPPLPIQKRIAEILEKADAAREKRRQTLALTEQFLQSAFLDMFGDPVLNPKGWTVNKLSDISKNIQYGYTASSTTNEVGPKLLRITDIQNGQVNWETVPYCECDTVEKYRLCYGDILFARTGATTGKSYLIRNCPLSIFASYLIRVQLNDLSVSEFVYHFFQSRSYWEQINKNITGSTQGGFNSSKLAEIQLPVPPLSLQQQFAAVVEKVEVMRAKQRESERELEQLFQSLMQRVFKGELVC